MERIHVQDVRDRVDILEYAAEHTDMKRVGRSWLGCCPIHNEKTPSFHVHQTGERGGWFKCFGCGASGSVIDLHMKIHRTDFKNALEALGARFGVGARSVPLPSRQTRRILPAGPAPAPPAPDIDATLAWAHGLFKALKEDALDCLMERQRPQVLYDQWEMGYAPDSYSALIDKGRDCNVPVEALIEAGLVALASETQRPFSLFRDRLMVPIRDETGRLVSFCGRYMQPCEKRYKWINGTTTRVFSKGNTLFGLDRAAPYIAESGTAILVEGYMDAMCLHLAGFQNTVAIMSTEFTEGQAAKLSGLCDEIVCLLDGDKAGEANAEKTVARAAQYGMEGRIGKLPEGDDPDDVVLREGGFDLLQDIIGTAMSKEDALLAEVIAKCKGLPPFERLRKATSICGNNIPSPRLSLALKLPSGMVEGHMRNLREGKRFT